MHPNALLDLAAGLIRETLRFESPADQAVASFLRSHRALGPRERHTLADTTYAVLRQRLLFEHLAQAGQGAIERRLAVLGWAGDTTFLLAALTPQEQQWLQQAQAVDRGALPDPLRHNLPEWIAAPLRERLGEAFWPLADNLGAAAPLDLRVNVLRCDREAARTALAEAGLTVLPTPYSPWGLRLAGKPALSKLALFTRGDVEVQDEGSQLIALLVGARRGELVVDFCAGAGGKTLALGAAMRNTGRLYALDTSGHRLAALKPRLARSGLSNVYPMQITHEHDERIERMVGKIDRVLVDAPCSGLGTLRRNPDLKWRQSPQIVRELCTAQAAILARASRLLKPGGTLVYATCSLLDAENESIAAAFSQTHPAFEAVDAAVALDKSRVSGSRELVHAGFLRLWPHRHGTDGFFAAVWRRRGA